jgi:hypothetical protein
MKISVQPKGKRYIMIPLGMGPIYAEKDGGMVLKTEVNWTKISGIWINTSKGCLWLQFRRVHKIWKKK